MKLFNSSILLLLISLNSSILQARDSVRTSLEIVAETDGTSELSGFHFLKGFKDNATNLSGYFGGGPVYVTLPEADDEFIAIHAVIGGSYQLTNFLSVNAEFGFDFVEEIFDSEDRGDETNTSSIDNHVDYSIAVGMMFTLEKTLYFKAYYRHHTFDGIFLPETSVDFTGIRFGINF